MYRLLIADDEALEREGLELTVTRLMPGVFEFIHAENGRIAIQRAEQHRPDIVFMDIKMPGIEGLEALRQMKEINPRMKMVVVSAYDYFSYAKQAMTLGAKEYLLKPAKKEQVAALLRRLIAEIKAEDVKRSEELGLEEKLSQLMPIVENEAALTLMLDTEAGSGRKEALELLGIQVERGCAIVLSLLEWPNEREDGGTDGDRLSREDAQRLYDAVKQYAKSQYSCLVSPVVAGLLTVFVLDEGTESADGELTRELAGQRAEGICGYIQYQFGPRFSCGVGGIYPETGGMRRSFREANAAAAAKGQAGIRHYGDLLAEIPPSPLLGLDVELEMERTRLEREHRGHGVIERAKRWIDERFCEDISMEQAAEYSRLSPFYFSKMFKLHVGETFIDYVTGHRIQKAKKLILGEELSLKEVCYQVGYKDPNYFSRVFKKVTGRSPKEYRDYPG